MPITKTAEHAFGTRPVFSLGSEEEMFLVDAVTGRMVNSSARVTERLGSAMAGIERELHAGMIEFVSDVCSRTREVIEQLAQRRAAALGTGVGLLGSGTHPTATEDEAEISDKERYERIHHLLGDAVATPVAGLHVHVGMPDPETAIRVFNAMRLRLPLLQALAANSPFRHARDTGLASARDVTIRGWPRSGVPRAMRDFQDFCDTAELLTRAADVEDYTWFWWKLRPHPKLGTVEIRALDTQGSLLDTAALVAFTHCLARAAAEDEAVEQLPSELLEEGMFRAARFGVRAQLQTRRANCTRSTISSQMLSITCSRTRQSSAAKRAGADPGARRRRWRRRPAARDLRAGRHRVAAARANRGRRSDVRHQAELRARHVSSKPCAARPEQHDTSRTSSTPTNARPSSSSTG